MDLASISGIEEMKTPCYIYSMSDLRKRIEYVRKCLGDEYGLCYSMKANPMILPYIYPYVDRIEVCSHGEFYICQSYGIRSDRIFYTGVNKRSEEINEALSYGVRAFNAESIHQFRILEEAARTHQVLIRIYIRISSGNQFGMSEADMVSVLQGYDREYVHIEGIHYFAGTAIRENKRRKQMAYVQEMGDRFKELTGNTNIEIEYGPGLPVRYFIDEEADMTDQALLSCVNDLRNITDSSDDHWTIEMGRYLAAECGSYLTRVEDIKKVDQTNYVIVDGGINHLNYYGQAMALRLPYIQSYRPKGGKVNTCKYWICGSLCTTADVLAKDVEIAELEIGDYLLFHTCGAYSNTEASYLFLSRDMPYIYLQTEEGDFKLIRDSISTYQWNGGWKDEESIRSTEGS